MTLKKPNCPSCGNRAEWFGQKIHCRYCSDYFDHANAPRILFLDIEKSRVKIEADIWETDVKHRQMRVTPDDIKDDWFILSWSACWIFGETFGAVVTPKEAKARDDKRITSLLFNVVKVADFVVTYNGNNFDLKKMNWRFMYHHFLPVPHYASMDVLAHLKSIIEPSSLSLDFISRQLGYDGKMDNPQKLHERCEAGEKEMLDHLLKYNKVDVDKTHDVYLHTRPYWKNHPNFAAFLDMYQEVDKSLDVGKNNHRCPRCLKGIISDEKFRKNRQTPKGYFYRIANCPHCGAVIYKVHREHQSSKHSQKVYVK